MNRYCKRLKNALNTNKNTVCFELKAFSYSIVGLVKAKLNKKSLYGAKVELGVGSSVRKKGFITNDINLKADYPFDLRMGLPFSDNSLRFIYSEHVLEHFEYKDLIALLSDCYRTLMSGGIFSCAIPDTSYFIKAYLDNDLKIIEEFKFKTGYSYRTKMDILNFIFYMGGHHRYMFDRESIIDILSDIGFKDIRTRDFDANLDREVRKHESFYLECTK